MYRNNNRLLRYQIISNYKFYWLLSQEQLNEFIYHIEIRIYRNTSISYSNIISYFLKISLTSAIIALPDTSFNHIMKIDYVQTITIIYILLYLKIKP